MQSYHFCLIIGLQANNEKIRSVFPYIYFLGGGVENRLDVGDDVFYGCFAFRVENIADNDCGQLGEGVFTFAINSRMERTSTKEEVPAVPEAWYWLELQVTPQYISQMKSAIQVTTNR